MPADLRCPTCSAALEAPVAGATAQRCATCGASVLVTQAGAELAPGEIAHHEAVGEVLRLLRDGHRMEAVQAYRTRLGGSLHDANDAVSRIMEAQPAGTIPSRAMAGSALGCAVLLIAVSLIALAIFVRLSTRDDAGGLEAPPGTEQVPAAGSIPADAP